MHLFHPLMELNTRTSNNMAFFGIWLWFEVEEMAEKLKMGLDAQKSFAQMYEDGNMENRVWKKVMQLDSVIIQKTTKEIGTRKTKTTLKIGCKSNDFSRIFIRTVVAQGWTPLDHRSSMLETLTNKGLQMELCALTWQPPLG